MGLHDNTHTFNKFTGSNFVSEFLMALRKRKNAA